MSTEIINPSPKQLSVMRTITDLKAEIAKLEAGYEFETVKATSARDLFGAEWYNLLSAMFDAETLHAHAKKNNLIESSQPSDAQLVTIQSRQFHSVQKNNNIEIKSFTEEENKYNGTYNVLATTQRDFTISALYTNTAEGRYVNVSKLNKKKDLLNQKLKELESLETPDITKVLAEKVIEQPENKNGKQEPVKKTEPVVTQEVVEPAQVIEKRVLFDKETVSGIVAVMFMAGVLVGMYMYFNYKNKQE